MCLEEENRDHLEDDSAGSNNTEDPFLDLVGSGLGYIDVQLGSSLTEAAKAGHEKCVETLIKAGADVNSTDVFGSTAISESAAYDHVECFKLLLNAGADINIKNKTGETPLLRAIFMQNGCAQLLMDAGSGVNDADNSGYSPIIVAASRSNCEQVESLIKAGADVNARTKARGDFYRYYPLTPGTTALMAAAFFHDALNTVKVLLRSGAYVNIRNEIGMNALENTYSGDYQSGGPLKETLTLLHAAGETTDGTKTYEFDISGITFTRPIEFPEYLRERHLTLTLKDMCREAIRKHLLDINQHLNLFMRIPQLGLPTRLAQYLLFEEDLKLSEEDLS